MIRVQISLFLFTKLVNHVSFIILNNYKLGFLINKRFVHLLNILTSQNILSRNNISFVQLLNIYQKKGIPEILLLI